MGDAPALVMLKGQESYKMNKIRDEAGEVELGQTYYPTHPFKGGGNVVSDDLNKASEAPQPDSADNELGIVRPQSDSPEFKAESETSDDQTNAEEVATSEVFDDDLGEDVAPIEEIDTTDEDVTTNWYILKVQSNREESIAEGLKRRVAVEGLERFFGDIIVPVEDVAEFKNGKKRITKRKLYPGYIVVNMAINEDTW